MRVNEVIVLTLAVSGLICSCAFAMSPTPEERGKALFNDPALGGGTAGRSCNSCHPDGKGLEGSSAKTEWRTPGGASSTLEGAVNTCITMALKGKALDPQSEQMRDIVAYIKSLSGKQKTKRAIEGC